MFYRDGDCDVTITADEGMVIVFSFPVLIFAEYQEECFDYLTLSTGTSIKSFLDDLVLRYGGMIFRFINFYKMQ